MSRIRVGWGCDAHRFGGRPPVVLGGVVVDRSRGVVATSDGDVCAHALADGLLGAANLGDLGDHFPSDHPAWHGVSSLDLLERVVGMARAVEVVPVFADVTVMAQSVRVAPHRQAISAGLARALGLTPDQVSVKATTTDGLGFLGRDEGLAAMAVVTAELGP